MNEKGIIVRPGHMPGSILEKHASELGGNTLRLGPTDLTNSQAQRILQVNAEDPTASCEFTVNLSSVLVSDPTATLHNHQLRARVGWGSAKGKSEALIDLKHGARLCLEGAYCWVDALYTFYTTSPALNFGPTYEVSASINPGTAAPQPNTLTISSGPVADGAGVLVTIPSWAWAVEIQDQRDPAAMVLPQVLTSFMTAANPAAARTMSRSQAIGEPITIPNGAEIVSLVNVAGGGATEIQAIFHLMI